MKNIAVIGAGTMGNGIAHTFAQFNYNVQLIDVSQTALDRAISIITRNLDRMIAKEKISEKDKKQTLSNITTFTSIKEGVKYASLVIEAASENALLKTNIFKELDEVCPEDTILVTKRPDKVIGMHFMNPVPIMKLVEIIKGYNTSDDVMDFTIELTKEINKIPVKVNDYPGFVANRILMPMINESIETLYNDVAGVREIDDIMKLGMAHPMGPLQLADFIGLDVCLSILNVMYDGFKNPKYAPCPLLVNMVAGGKLGIKSGEGFYDYTSSKKSEKVAKMFL